MLRALPTSILLQRWDKPEIVVSITKHRESCNLSDGGKNTLGTSSVSVCHYGYEPAFALTTYKVQGLTLDHAYISPSVFTNTIQRYVALSRVRAFINLTLLGPMSTQDKLKLDDVLRSEMARLTRLVHRTLAVTNH